MLLETKLARKKERNKERKEIKTAVKMQNTKAHTYIHCNPFT